MRMPSTWIGLLAITALLGCGGYRWPSERRSYEVAAAAVRADPALPKDAKLWPIDQCEIYVQKNSAFVQVFYDYTDASGRTQTDSYIVWLKRIARRWELDSCAPMPRPQ